MSDVVIIVGDLNGPLLSLLSTLVSIAGVVRPIVTSRDAALIIVWPAETKTKALLTRHVEMNGRGSGQRRLDCVRSSVVSAHGRASLGQEIDQEIDHNLI